MLTSVFLLTYTASAVNKSGHKYFSSEMPLVIMSIRYCEAGAFFQFLYFSVILVSLHPYHPNVATLIPALAFQGCLNCIIFPAVFRGVYNKFLHFNCSYFLEFGNHVVKFFIVAVHSTRVKEPRFGVGSPERWQPSSFRVICLRFCLIMAALSNP